jgi:hypothetical protein
LRYSLKDLEKKALIDTDFPDEDRHLKQMEFDQIYRNIHDDMTGVGLPLVHPDDLHTARSCRPNNHEESEENMILISSMLYKRLAMLIPSTNSKTKRLITPYYTSRAGYEALYAIARTSLPYLRDTALGWGPTWEIHEDPSTYVAKLQTKVSELRHTDKAPKTDYEQSQEMLYQAMQGYNFSAGCCKRSELNMHVAEHPSSMKRLPREYRITELIHYFNDFPKAETPRVPHPKINRLDNNNTRRRPFEFKNKTQCECCKAWGHNIGDQICRTAAHIHHTMAYMKTKDKQEQYLLNATKFAQMNAKHIVNYVSKHQPLLDATEHENEREKFIQELQLTTANTTNNNKQSEQLPNAYNNDHGENSLITIE